MKPLIVIALLSVACGDRPNDRPGLDMSDSLLSVLGDAAVPDAASCDMASSPDLAAPDLAPTCGGFNQRCCNGTTCIQGSVCSGGLCVCDRLRNACGFQCMDLQSDPDNCGACGVRCAINEACCGGACTSPLRDPANCGGCGIACDPPNHNTMTCSTGKCGIGTCDSGWADCNHSTADGCETSITTIDNCGACGNKCPACAQCVNGACAFVPPGGACKKACECQKPVAPGDSVGCANWGLPQQHCCQFGSRPWSTPGWREYIWDCGSGWKCFFLNDQNGKEYPCP